MLYIAIAKNTVLELSLYAYPVVGGIETQLRYISSMKSKVFDIKIISFLKSGADRSKLLPNISYMADYFDSLPVLLKTFIYPPLLFLRGFVFAVNNRNVRVIHAHGLYPLIAAFFLSKIIRSKLVLTFHMLYSPKDFRWLMIKLLADRVDKMIFISKYMQNYYVSHGVGKANSQVIYNWADETLFYPREKGQCRKNLGLPDKKIVLYVGRLEEDKGAQLIPLLARRLPKIHFLIVGDGSLYSAIARQCSGLGNARLLKNITFTELPPYYSAADITVVPSICEEGFSLVAAESLMCGTPVLGSNRGSLPEIIPENAGAVVEPEVEKMSKAIETLLNRINQSLSSEASAYALERLSSKNLQKLTKLYGELL